MNSAGSAAERSRWGPTSINLGRLDAAPTDEHLSLHLAAIEYELSSPITIESQEDIQSRKHWSEKLKPYEHQVRNLITFCRRAPVALFADDVGLGKTISAGLVLSELRSRKKVRRALILCPRMLLDQWKEELEEKFGINAAAGVGQDLNTWLRQAVPVVITTYESARDRMETIRAASFDMLILDEAHKLRNLHGTASAPQVAKVLHASLRNRDFRYVLMLTATPIQNRLWDLYSLVDCLATARGHANPLGDPQAFVHRYVADSGSTARRLEPRTREEFRRKVQEYMVRTSRKEAHLAFPERRVLPVQCLASAAERGLQGLVGETFEGLNALARTSLAVAQMSSPRALLTQVRNMTQTGTLPWSSLDSITRGVEAAGAGCKLGKLLEILEEFRTRNPHGWRVLIFTQRTETVELIRSGLESKGIPTGTIQGNTASQNRRSIQLFNEEPPVLNVLVSTDAGAVGLNLQVCNVVINFDLPWNPMVLEQRIGRVQRLGSKFKFVEVLNLTVANSIEDVIVARLISKLQVISSTIGDVEAILEASTFEDDNQFVESLKDMVTRALMGQDISAAIQQAEESIRRAKEIYDSERAQVDATLGSLDEMHRAGARVPKLKPKTPRFDVRAFCQKAFGGDGATVTELHTGQLRVSPRGQASWIATFDEKDPDLLRAGLGTFGGTNVRLYADGSRAFEGLLGEWRRRYAHRVIDRAQESRALTEAVVTRWIEGLGLPLRLSHWAIQRERPYFQGEFEIRAAAAISHDRFEKLCLLPQVQQDHGNIPPPSPSAVAAQHLEIGEVLPQAKQLVATTVEQDSDIREFIRFYEERSAEESPRAGGPAQQQEVLRRYQISLNAEFVGARGYHYLAVEVRAVIGIEGQPEAYEAELHLVPLSGKVLAEPTRAVCAATGVSVPAVWLEECSQSKQRVLRHQLERSALSGLPALSQFLGTCQTSGRRVLLQELAPSDFSGKRVAKDLLRRSELGGKQGLAEEMGRCDFTGASVLLNELVRSDISKRMVRCDQVATSAVSGARGHTSEFRTCEETGAKILPGEGGHSDVSARFVRSDLLVASEKNPSRHGLKSETVKCSVTSRRLLRDEAEQSAISRSWVDKELLARSSVSGRPARPDELIRCSETGLLLLPAEAGSSSVSGKMVDARLLVVSAISGKRALKSELKTCAFTGAHVLPAEGAQSEVSGKFVRGDQIVASILSKVRGHQSEFVRCHVSKDWILPHEAGVSAVSGVQVRPDLLQTSEKAPGRKGIATEFVVCAVSGRKLLRDEVARSEVSGRIVDDNLLKKSDGSGRLALEDELVVCEESGGRFLPDEMGHCAISGKRVNARLLISSEVSERQALKCHAGRCEFTGVLALSDELGRSDVSGKWSRLDHMEASALSQKRAHRTELVTCELSGQRLLPSEIAKSTVSGRQACRDLLVASQKALDRIGFPDEAVVCAATSKRLLVDEAQKSDLSGRWVDRDLALRSSVSNRIGLPGEMVYCEETGAVLLPDETEVCAITGRRAERQLIGTSDVTNKRGLLRLLQVCPETGRRGFAEEFAVCAVSGLRVAPEQVATCAVSGNRVLQRLMIRCAITDQWLRRDLAVASEKSGRLALPSLVRPCVWTGRQLLQDELRPCSISRLEFDQDLVPEGSPAMPVLGLLQEGVPSDTTDDPSARAVRSLLAALGAKAKGIRTQLSNQRPVVAFLADCSTLFGFKKRQVLGLALLQSEASLLGPAVFGKLENNTWIQEQRPS